MSSGTAPGCWPLVGLWSPACQRNKALQRGSMCASSTSEDSGEVTCVVSTVSSSKPHRNSTQQHSPACVLDAVSKLLTDTKYNDVLFITMDGEVQANRAYLAARCSYFECLLYGPHKEGSLAKIHLPHASSAALRHVLQYLHSGELPSQEHNWRVLVEACSLSQQYLLPEVLALTTELLVAQLTPANFGPSLSYALQEGLDAVVKRLWLACPGLMPIPVSFHGFSAAAVSFCLDHTCCATVTHASANGGAGGEESQDHSTAPMAAEWAVLLAVLKWCQEAAAGCEACCTTIKTACGTQRGDACIAAEPAPRSTCSMHTTSSSTLQHGSCIGSRCAAAHTAHSCYAAVVGELEEPQTSGVVLCEEHLSYLEAFLTRLNWPHLGQEAMQRVERLQLLSQRALLQVYRAHASSMHAALQGRFALCDGMRLRLNQGHEVLECSSIQHITVATAAPLTSGLHCWEVRCQVACSLTWVGVTDGSLHGDGWGGKQPGGYFYGCNDALCNASSSEQRLGGVQHCGHGPWGDGSVLQFFLDMDERELWISVDGARAKLGFRGLPASGVYPAVSVRAPAQMSFTFRLHSWCMGS